jgi:DNA processing protein
MTPHGPRPPRRPAAAGAPGRGAVGWPPEAGRAGRAGGDGRPGWWVPGMPAREVMLALAATPGALPAVTAERLAGGAEPAALLRPHSPDPAQVASRLGALGARLLLPSDPGWPLAATPPGPPCAWLFVAGPVPPGPAASVAVVGGRRASPLRRAAARALGAGLAAAGWSVVSGGAVGVDAAAHQGALDGGGHTVVVLGCGLDVSYPRANAGLFAAVRAAGGTVVTEHPPGCPPRAANFLPRNRLIAALAAAVVVVEAGEGSGSLSTARAAGGRGGGRVFAVPGAPWDPGAAGCNGLVRDGATLVRGLPDILDELGPPAAPPPGLPADHPAEPTPAAAAAATRRAAAAESAAFTSPSAESRAPAAERARAAAAEPARAPAAAGSAGAASAPAATASGVVLAEAAGAGSAGAIRPDEAVASPSGRPQPAPPRGGPGKVLAALVDGQVLGTPQLAAATGLAPDALAAALVDLELAGLVRRTAAGVQALALAGLPGHEAR